MAQSGILSGDDFSVEFSDREVPAWGLPEFGSDRGYEPRQLAEQFLVSIGCGACRFPHLETVRMDNMPGRLFGWTKAAWHKALVLFFNRFDMLRNEQVKRAV